LFDVDYDLLSRCLKKEVAAEYKLYQRFAPRVFGICLRYGGNELEAEEIMQIGFMRLFSNLDRFRFDGSLESWVRSIFVRTAINYNKNNLKFSQDVELADMIVNVAGDDEILTALSVRELLAVIQRLPVGYRTIFNLHVIEEYKHREIAELLGISEGTSKSQLHHAKAAVRDLLNGWDKEFNTG
jgi:RNA polymerase sigma factor (sigma-70 family)